MTMDEVHRDIAALADGTLAPARRDETLRRVAEAPALSAALADQRAALAAIYSTADEPASEALRASVAAMAAAQAPPPRRRARLRGPLVARPRWALAGSGGLAALLGAAVLLLSGGAASGPTVAEAARVAFEPARASAPAPWPDEKTLAASVDGVSYPYWADSAGWKATGARADVLHGRTVRTVFYANARGRRIGYAIAAGPALDVSGGRVVERDGVKLRLLRSGDTAIVTWLRNGHTCIIAARGVDPGVLLRLASWRA